MKKHCKGCKYHHNAGHSKESNLSTTYNDWCVLYYMPAKHAIGRCKLNKGKVDK